MTFDIFDGIVVTQIRINEGNYHLLTSSLITDCSLEWDEDMRAYKNTQIDLGDILETVSKVVKKDRTMDLEITQHKPRWQGDVNVQIHS